MYLKNQIIFFFLFFFHISLFRFVFVDFVLLSLVSFYFVFISLISFRFVSFLLISFRFVSFSLISFRFVSFRFVSFRFVSFLFRFALYRCPQKQSVLRTCFTVFQVFNKFSHNNIFLKVQARDIGNFKIEKRMPRHDTLYFVYIKYICPSYSTKNTSGV